MVKIGKRHLTARQHITMDNDKERYNYYMSKSRFGMARKVVNKIRKTGKGTLDEGQVNAWCDASMEDITSRESVERYTRV